MPRPVRGMTKQHFEFIAKTISFIKDPIDRSQIAFDTSYEISKAHPNFDVDRFLAACKCATD
jgi:hypothetical protein